MKRPAWAESGWFTSAWTNAETLHEPTTRHATLTALAKSHVLNVAKDQVDVLPYIGGVGSGIGEWWEHLQLPFDPMFIDLNHAVIDDGISARAAIVSRCSDGRLQIAPWAAASPECDYVDRSPEVDSVRRGLGHGTMLGYVERAVNFDIGDSAGQIRFQSFLDIRDGLMLELVADLARLISERVIAVLSWLESVNVDLAEVPISAKARAREIGKGRKIALTVQVKQPKVRRRQDPSGHHRDFSHRFEVRGHYMHFPEDTRIGAADPTKLSFVPGRGFVRKVWCPPHVKGPLDKPLVPKVRRVELVA